MLGGALLRLGLDVGGAGQFVGGALGSLLPIPGVGTAVGTALGGALSKAHELEQKLIVEEAVLRGIPNGR